MNVVQTGTFRTGAELRAMAREQLRGIWGRAVLICLVYSLIIMVLSNIPWIGSWALLAVTGALVLGLSRFFIKLPRGQQPEIPDLFSRFSHWLPALGLYVITSVFVFLWMLLLIVPGIIASLRYSQVYYIMNDNPGIGIMDAIRRSSEMMQGHKTRLFLLYLSFIGWALLSAITFGVGFLWLFPYMMASAANFYEELKRP